MTTTTNKIGMIKISESLREMTEMIIANHDLANQCIRENNRQMAVEVFEKDKQVDHEFFLIQSEIEFMITKGLVTKNLRRALAFLHIVSHLERIGDYAKKIAKFVIKSEKPSLSSVRRITKVQNQFVEMIKDVPQIIYKEDAKLAKAVWQKDDLVDSTTAKIQKEVVASISRKSSKLEIVERIFVLNIANSFERAADHITSICELVQYIETGQHFNLD